MPEAACTPGANASTCLQDTQGEGERPEPPQVSAGPKGASQAAHAVSSAQDVTVFSGQCVLWSGWVTSEPSHCTATVVILPIAITAPEEEEGLISLSSPSLLKKTVLPNVSTFTHCYSNKVSYLLLHQSILLLNGYG